MNCRLLVLAGVDKGIQFPLQGPVVIGRGDNATLQLRDPRVSRAHCQVLLQGNNIVISDIGSRSGTFVNGRPVQGSQLLRPGDVIQIGETQVRLDLLANPNDRTLAPAVAAPSAPTALAPNRSAPTALGLNAQKQGPGKSGPVGIGNTPKLPAERLHELSGHKLGYFEVGQLLARGQSGVIFKARDTQRNLEVALKVLWPEFARDENEVQRFIRAMKTILPLRHPNIVVLYAAGKTGPYCWLSMELGEGESVARGIQRLNTGGQVNWRSALRIGVFATRGLEYAHSQSIVHRNITPQNILLGKQPHITKLADLMLAKAMEGKMAEHITKP